jgi:hypothetical protein
MGPTRNGIELTEGFNQIQMPRMQANHLQASERIWISFLRSLIKRGLKGVQLVISDAREGLRTAINPVFVGSSWCASSEPLGHKARAIV